MLLVGRALIGVAGRNRDAVDAELRHRIEEGGDALRSIRRVEEGAIDGDAEAACLGALQRRDGAVVDARLADRFVVHLLVAIEMDRPGEIAGSACIGRSSSQQQRVGADDRKFLARDDALDDLWQILVQQRLAAGHHDDRRAAFIDRGERVLDRNPLVEDGVGIIDLAATRASEIAAEQAAPASARADSACGPRDAGERHRRRSEPFAELVFPMHVLLKTDAIRRSAGAGFIH